MYHLCTYSVFPCTLATANGQLGPLDAKYGDCAGYGQMVRGCQKIPQVRTSDNGIASHFQVDVNSYGNYICATEQYFSCLTHLATYV